MEESLLTQINQRDFSNKSVLLIGAGEMANHYAKALSEMGFNDVTVIGKGSENVKRICQEYGFTPLSGGFENQANNLKKMNLVLVATPTESLIPITKIAIESGQRNILIEKPGSVRYQELLELDQSKKDVKIRVAWQRLLYPSFQKLKKLVELDGGITSCRFMFTERIHSIPFEKYSSEIYNRWGIVNSLHIISMAIELISKPKEISSYQLGELDWHPSGAIFVGSGISEKNIPFSYHADWKSSGRWGLEVMTEKNAYQLIPVEELYQCKKGTSDWKSVDLKIPFPNVKQGVAEEIALMLENDAEKNFLVNLEKSSDFNKVAEKIFNYS